MCRRFCKCITTATVQSVPFGMFKLRLGQRVTRCGFFLSSLGNNIWQRRDKMFTRENFYVQGTYEKKKKTTTLTLFTLCSIAPLDWVVIDGLIIWSGDRQKKIGN